MRRLTVAPAAAAGRYCPRTAELTPSAPTSRSRLGPPPVGEMQPHAFLAGSVLAGFVLAGFVLADFVSDQLAAEDEPAPQPGRQYLPQGLAVDRGRQGGGRVWVGRRIGVALFAQALLAHDVQPLAHHRQSP